MSEPPFSDARIVLASGLAAKTVEIMADAGLTPLEAAHGLIRKGLEEIAPAVGGCAGCACVEYEALLEVVERLLEDAEAIADGAEHRVH